MINFGVPWMLCPDYSNQDRAHRHYLILTNKDRLVHIVLKKSSCVYVCKQTLLKKKPEMERIKKKCCKSISGTIYPQGRINTQRGSYGITHVIFTRNKTNCYCYC